MFVLADQYVFWFPVDVSVPDEKLPGKFIKQSFEVQFEALALDEARQIDREMADLSPVELREREHELLTRVIKDWRGIVGEDKADIPFSETALKAAMQFAWVRTALYQAYAKAMSGEAKRGN